ncbi:putative polynucleotide adenylyltransferase [Helianthus anomalus]
MCSYAKFSFQLLTLFLRRLKETFKLLLCHPHPSDFPDKSNPFHCSYLLGFQRKEGVFVNDANKFDIRSTIDEFKGNVGSYTTWKPGMGINVTLIKHRDIPAFVFPGGVRPPCPARASVEERRNAPDTKAVWMQELR